jgi:hypothetical protein
MLPIPMYPPFSRPLLIYDDKCSSCWRFAYWARRLSGGWIRLAGHYYSPEATKVKRFIFPDGYDPTKMFWLINKNGAFGARSALMEVFKEIIRGLYKTRLVNSFSDNREGGIFAEDEDGNVSNGNSCSHLAGSGCTSFRDTLTRLVGMLSNSDRYRHHVK